MSKISIRFFEDREVRAIWDETDSKWWFSVLDIVGVLNAQDDYTKNRNYWKYLKNKLKNEGNEVVSVTNQLKLFAPDGKRRLTDILDYDGVVLLAKSFPNTRASRFVEWFTNSDESKVCNRYTATFSAVSTASPARSVARPSAKEASPSALQNTCHTSCRRLNQCRKTHSTRL